jgi:hypothetical protein
MPVTSTKPVACLASNLSQYFSNPLLLTQMLLEIVPALSDTSNDSSKPTYVSDTDALDRPQKPLLDTAKLWQPVCLGSRQKQQVYTFQLHTNTAV